MVMISSPRPNRPIAMGTKSSPSESSAIPKVIRGAPELIGVRTRRDELHLVGTDVGEPPQHLGELAVDAGAVVAASVGYVYGAKVTPALGAERVMFSVDYPMDDNETGAQFLASYPMDDATRRKISCENAARLFGGRIPQNPGR